MQRLVLIFVISVAACGENKSTGEAGSTAGGAIAPVTESVPAEVVARLGDGEPFEVTGARPWDAVACVSGTRSGLEILVCRYGTEAAALEAKKKLSGFLSGAQSGVVTRTGTSMMAIADKSKADPKGYEIARLVEAFAPGSATNP